MGAGTWPRFSRSVRQDFRTDKIVKLAMSERNPKAQERGKRAAVRASAPFTPRDETIGFLLWDARRAVAREFDRTLALHGLRNGLFSVLRVLWDEDSLTQSEIARRSCLTGPTIVGVVAQLESQGLIVRTQYLSDSRKRNIQLTDEGVRLRAVVLPLIEDNSAKALAGFSATEREQFKNMLLRVRANFTVDDDDTNDETGQDNS
ncbi:MAG: MarR family transcriptional regulator [Rhizobiales bacterium]|nr:MarR family transcriptional regulator [Hyphomicrobiales bacterium]